MIDGIQYMNTGDWVDSGTAVVEHFDGRMGDCPLDRSPPRASVEVLQGAHRLIHILMGVLIATDAWKPQVNGVVNTYSNLEREAANAGLDLTFLTPSGFRTMPLPTYSEIQLAMIRPRDVAKRVEQDRPDFIHIATEGPIGLARARLLPERRAAVHHQLSHPISGIYLCAHANPAVVGLRFERWFHNAGSGVMAASLSLCQI